MDGAMTGDAEAIPQAREAYNLNIEDEDESCPASSRPNLC
jgi:hypothetical protein